ncbi:MAG: hypothetical protein J6W64_05775 [Bacilli bacterium]|nr:hypothetical protein [Bacilli bacterium]
MEVDKLKDVYMTNCYRPNSTLIKTYPKTAKKEIQLKPNEEIIDIPNTNRCAVLNNNTYYYKDMEHHGFVLPQNNDEY